LGAGGTHGYIINNRGDVYADPRYVQSDGATALGHEMGHGYGLSHSRIDGSDQDCQDPWDIMSINAWPTPAPDLDYGRRGPGLNAANMRGRGWLDDSRVWGAPLGDFNQTIQLRPLHRHDLPGILAAELPPIEIGRGRYIVEFR